jgi:hypothetical protein
VNEQDPEVVNKEKSPYHSLTLPDEFVATINDSRREEKIAISQCALWSQIR